MSWRDEAACLGHPVDWWFPGVGDVDANRRARAICRTCPVREECLIDCFKRESARDCGTRGGFAGNELSKLKTRWRRGLPFLQEVA